MNRSPLVLIDDDVEDLEVYKDVLLSMNLQQPLIAFDDPYDGLDFLITAVKSPFLIFCNIDMHELNGLELRKKMLEAEHQAQNTPFIFLSTLPDLLDVQKGHQLAVQGCFYKPASIQGFKKLFTTVIDYWTYSMHPGLGLQF